ncbi:MAG: hypothetical protein P1V51_23210 [Deltaproteobacteria bacterium]|nr:hypothetical protein [Deltaproteobacteria bacterium]
MRPALLAPLLALLTATACFTTVPSSGLSLEAFDLQATVDETRGGRVRVSVTLNHCGVSWERITLAGTDRLEASLDGETIELSPPIFSLGGTYEGIFPRGTESGEVSMVLLRTPGSRARPGATVMMPAKVRITSPARREPVSRGTEDLAVRWSPLRGEDEGSLGADRAAWEVRGAEACSSEDQAPDFRGDLELGRRDDGFVLPAGTLALPALSGSGSCKSELVVLRSNVGLVDEGFCGDSSIRAERVSARVFKSTP